MDGKKLFSNLVLIIFGLILILVSIFFWFNKSLKLYFWASIILGALAVIAGLLLLLFSYRDNMRISRDMEQKKELGYHSNSKKKTCDIGKSVKQLKENQNNQNTNVSPCFRSINEFMNSQRLMNEC